MSLVEEKLIIPEPDFISGLNSEQKKAVMNMDGPLLVLSGAGTGKTKVLTTRLANIIHSRKASISNILKKVKDLMARTNDSPTFH